MTKTTYKKLYYLIIVAVILLAIAQASRIFAPMFINTDNAFIQIKMQEQYDDTNNNVFFVGLIILFIMMFNFIYHQIDKAEKGVISAVAMVLAGSISYLIDILFTGHQVNYLKIGGLPTVNIATFYLIIGWIIWIGSFLMYSSQHDLELKKIYEAQDEELATGKSSRIENVDEKRNIKNNKNKQFNKTKNKAKKK